MTLKSAISHPFLPASSIGRIASTQPPYIARASSGHGEVPTSNIPAYDVFERKANGWSPRIKNTFEKLLTYGEPNRQFLGTVRYV
ncbi:hypothetical protein TNCV_3572071 [Trichonephila clavipes]|nr:hypothetical protein TNCV_3572071 [Trichonephila clavipes]